MLEETSNPDTTAAAWMAKRDRGLTAAEQDDFLEWLRADTRHAEAWRRANAVWTRLDRLQDWRPKHSDASNPDLLQLPPPRRRPFPPLWTAAAAAAALCIGFFMAKPAARQTSISPPAANTSIVRHEPHRRTLSDGSVVEWRPGTTFEEIFSDEERRIILRTGEAHFAVAKNPARPFIVEAGRTTVRAVGTAFAVQRGERQVDVLVTEGKVLVQPDILAAQDPSAPPAPLLQAGDRMRIDATTPGAALAISRATPAEIDKALAWQGLRLEFRDLPLRQVVDEFNRHARGPRLAVAGDATGTILIGGTFRADNVDAFVRLLESSFGVTAEPGPNGVVTLRRR